jgi:hypothetical protein
MKETTKLHTPGPWSILCLNSYERPGIEALDGTLSIVVIGFKDDPLDDCGVDGETREQELANARLIAAAPDLLQALEDVMPYIIGDKKVPWRAAQEAIAKATEQQDEPV